MRSFRTLSWIAFVLMGTLATANVPSGFDEKGLIDDLLKGKIVSKDITSSSKELKVLYRLYFHKVKAADYVAKIEQHDDYKKMFSKIKDSRRLKTVTAGKRYDYEISMEISSPLGKKTVTPVVEQTITLAAKDEEESFISDVVANYEDDIHEGGLETRIVPYKDGLLVAQTAHLHLKNYLFIGNTKKEFREGLRDMLAELRDELNANP